MTAPRRITSSYLDHLRMALTPRDLAIVASLARLRLASGGQLRRLHFTSGTPLSNARQTRAALERLAALRVVARLERRIGGIRGGSSNFVYALDVAGQRLADLAGPWGGQRPRRPWTPNRLFVSHALAVSELHVRLVEAERQGRCELLRFDTEPACWRDYPGPGGGRAVLKPDAFVHLVVPDYETFWLVEVDRATEWTPALVRKFDAYRRYWTTGKEQARLGGVFPQVLWLAPSETRKGVLVDVAGAQPTEVWPLHRIVLYADAVRVMTEAA